MICFCQKHKKKITFSEYRDCTECGVSAIKCKTYEILGFVGVDGDEVCKKKMFELIEKNRIEKLERILK